MSGVAPCPECGGKSLYSGPPTSAGGGHAPNYLPGLGRFFSSAKFVLVVCRDCGLTRFYAQPDARAELTESSKWRLI
jgi:predicted nucleic-acid-binding Zn-ribbon protein